MHCKKRKSKMPMCVCMCLRICVSICVCVYVCAWRVSTIEGQFQAKVSFVHNRGGQNCDCSEEKLKDDSLCLR